MPRLEQAPFATVLLAAIAVLVAGGARANDVAARYGGEEFVAILPEANRITAAKIAVNMRKAIEAKQVEFQGQSHQVTASFGVALLEEAVEEAIRRAGQALYAAKKNGRNRCESVDMV